MPSLVLTPEHDIILISTIIVWLVERSIPVFVTESATIMKCELVAVISVDSNPDILEASGQLGHLIAFLGVTDACEVTSSLLTDMSG